MPLITSRMGVSSKWGCGGQEVPDKGPEGPAVSYRSYLTTFIDWSPLGNASKYVKNGGVLMPSKWGCGGQEVPDDSPNAKSVS